MGIWQIRYLEFDPVKWRIKQPKFNKLGDAGVKIRYDQGGQKPISQVVWV